MKVVQVQGLWCLVEGWDIIEAYDTKYEALQAFGLAEFDRTRSWKSLWDMETEK